MKKLILLILFTLPFKSFALKECHIWKVDQDVKYIDNGVTYVSNYFKKHDSAVRGDSIQGDPKKKKIRRGQGFGTCKRIAERLIGVLCNTPFRSNRGYTGNYGIGNSYKVPSKEVTVDRLHFAVLKDLSINGTNIFNNNRNQAYIDCR